MAVSFNIPASPKINIYQNEHFLGCDFTSDASTVDETKSPDCVNMTRLVPGKVRKRMGYYSIANYRLPIYGVHKFSPTDTVLVHAGNKIFNLSKPMGKEWVDHSGNKIVDYSSDHIVFLTGDPSDTVVYPTNSGQTPLAQRRSWSVELGGKLVILDGANLFTFDGTTFKVLDSNSCYIPTVTIGRSPSGGGTNYDALNLLNPAFKDSFYVKEAEATRRDFKLSFAGLDATPVKAWVSDASGNWIEKRQGTDFTVDRSTGIVTFATAPGKTLTGEDNVRIQAYRTVSGYADRIKGCRFGILFGVNGANDRLFVSGNSGKGMKDGVSYSYINYDWFSGEYDPTYFPDTGYSKLGADSSAIMGYSIIGGYLATYKDIHEVYQPVIIREGDLINDNPTFLVINSLQGAGAVSPWCFAYLEEEPLFLSNLGIYAITAQDITGEKYAQNRSYYLDGKLLNEEKLEEAFAFTYRDLYILCINKTCYVLDGLQPMRTDKSMPYATRQYVGFYWTNINASVMFEMDGNLCFGSSDGNVYMFYVNRDDPDSYSDETKDGNKVAITCKWETADITERLFYKYKKYRYLALKCMPSKSSSVIIESQRNGLWEVTKEDATSMRYFDFTDINFSKFSFDSDATAKIISSKVRLRRLDKARFRFTNNKLNEPLGIENFAVEYTQGGSHK